MKKAAFVVLSTLGACGGTPAERVAYSAPPEPVCEAHDERGGSALQDAVVACAARTMRVGVAIEGAVSARVESDPGGDAAITRLEVEPADRRATFDRCLSEQDLDLPPCTFLEVALAFESEIELPAQDRSGVAYSDSSPPRLIRGEGSATNAVVIRAADRLTEAQVRRALSIDFHRAVESCFVGAAEAALRGGVAFDPSVEAVISTTWEGDRGTRERVVSSPSSHLSACLNGDVRSTIRPRDPSVEWGSAQLVLPMRRYLHPDVLAAMR